EIAKDPQRITIGWIGGANNIGPLFKLVDALETLFVKYPQLHLRIVGAGPTKLPPFEQVRWSCVSNFSQDEMVCEVLKFDIGLFPLFHNEDGRGRGTLKAMVYMAGEAAVVAEDFGENPKLISDGVNGLLASATDSWI